MQESVWYIVDRLLKVMALLQQQVMHDIDLLDCSVRDRCEDSGKTLSVCTF